MKTIEIYTDGACRGNPDGPGGYGVVMRYIDQDGTVHIKELSEGFQNTTNNRMELMGVLKALQALKNPCSIKLHTDSQYIVKAFNEGWLENWIKHKWKRGKSKEAVKNQDLWEKIVEAIAPHKVEFIWVRGHNGHPDNERCDVLATLAADNGPYQVDVK
jgi:ribonuclease HI